MGYDIFKLGALYLSDEIQYIPQQPTEFGDVPWYDDESTISIAPTSHKDMLRRGQEKITWIKPSGLNLLVADRILLSSVSWEDLDKNGFVAGKTIRVDGQHFRCRLLQVGGDRDISNEWDKALDETGEDNSLWHWEDMYFWGADTSTKCASTRAIRGHYSARYWDNFSATFWDVDVGFRPVLEPLGPDNPKSNCTLDGTNFCLSSIPGGDGFCPILQPVQKDVFTGIPNGQQLRMYTLMENRRPVHMDEQIKDLAQVTLTDRYFGDEYLIPWIISNGVAVTSQSVKKQV